MAAFSTLQSKHPQNGELLGDEALEGTAVAQVPWYTQERASRASYPALRVGLGVMALGLWHGKELETPLVVFLFYSNHPTLQFIHTQVCWGTSDPGSLQFNPLAWL